MAATLVQYLGTGRRKTSVARVFLRPGKGEITVNGRAIRELFPDREFARHGAAAAAGHRDRGQVRCPDLADGGGVTGQAGAARLGIARALVEFNAELRPRLKKLGFLTRDPAQARAQEVRPEGRPQAVPVLQALSFVREAAVGRPFSVPLLFATACLRAKLLGTLTRGRKSRFGPCDAADHSKI